MNWKGLMFVYGVGTILATWINMVIIVAMSTTHPDYLVLISTNSIGECWPEIVIFVSGGICFLYTALPLIKKAYKQRDLI